MISILRTYFLLITVAIHPLIAIAQSSSASTITIPSPSLGDDEESDSRNARGAIIPSGSLPTITTTITTTAIEGNSALAPRQTATETACNNSPALCDRSYANVTHMGAHGSAFLRDASTNDSIAGNQHFNATAALDAGLRLLQVQVHHSSSSDDDDGGAAAAASSVLELCHTACWLLDAGPLSDWLARIRAWMDDHPDEVVTLLIVNSAGASAAEFGAVFEDAGIDGYGYAPSTTSSEWPTLRDMIAANKRLVTFVAPLTTTLPDTATHPYLLSEFDHVFETAYEVTAPTSQTGFNCTVDRPSSSLSAQAAISEAGFLPLLNHFAYRRLAADVLIPDVDGAAAVNSPADGVVGALGRHAQMCSEEWGGVAPTFVLVDFWEQGPSVDTADAMNAVVAPVGRVNSTAAGTSTTGDDNDGSTGDDGTGAGTGTGGSTGSKLGGGGGTGALVAFIVGALLLVR